MSLCLPVPLCMPFCQRILYWDQSLLPQCRYKIKCLYLLDHFASPLFVFMVTYKSNKIIGALKKPVTRRGKNKREGKLTEYSEITANMSLGSQSRAQTKVHKFGQLRASTE